MNEFTSVLNEVKKAVSGKTEEIAWILMALLAGGHVLIEDIPGVGKTTMVRAFSRVLGLSVSRMQFTPDVLPSDITGFSVYEKESGTLRYVPGAIFANLFMADELNRAVSRTQSALLEAMEEKSVTVDGVTRALPDPFFVIATQNPAGAAGTQLLPDSQTDRFMIRLTMGYPDAASEVEMVQNRMGSDPVQALRQVLDRERLAELQKQISMIYIKPEVIRYVVDIMNCTRTHPMIRQGASPRATLAVVSMAKATAFISNRNYVIPDDVAFVLEKTAAHRLILSKDAQMNHLSASHLLKEILASVKAPVI
ncbi:MAG: MoxR family ATPase [Solobacterium sp.]|nr:MoxR family ATPase [Solobacterium sp.]